MKPPSCLLINVFDFRTLLQLGNTNQLNEGTNETEKDGIEDIALVCKETDLYVTASLDDANSVDNQATNV